MIDEYDNEYLFKEDLVEDIALKVMELIQPKLDLLVASSSTLCQGVAKLTIDVGIIEARQEGRSEEEIKILKDISNAMLDIMKRAY